MEVSLNPNTSESSTGRTAAFKCLKYCKIKQNSCWIFLVCVNLVETSGNPNGVQLVNPHQTTKASDPMDLVELARQIQKVINV